MNEAPPQSQSPSSDGQAPAGLRVVLLADDQALHCYGPVLRRLAVGLLDEVADLTLMSLGTSKLLNYVPSPPVRLITEAKPGYEKPARLAAISRQVSVPAPMFNLIDKLRPQRRVARFAAALAKYRPTLLHALSERQARLASHLSQQMAVPYVISVLSMDHATLNLCPGHCRAILPCNSALARRIRRRQPQLARRVRLLPIGTHVTNDPVCFDHGRSAVNIFCCGPWEYHCGLADLINAVKRLTLNGHPLHLTLSGQGSAEHDLRRQVARLRMHSTVHFVPPVEALIRANEAYKAVLREVDIFVQPWPLRIWRPELLESMSVGNAVVVADGYNNDLVINNKTALTVPFQDEHALVATLERLLKDPTYARALAKRAQQYLRKHFLASRMIARLGRIYRRASLSKSTHQFNKP